ncbi:MucBP domain-containing protein [Lactiplantibacillus daowaiensis]|uniref:MucBP domain-containing protein n=1 Tax=Lactiplantibacillus daowaiensis TaxID=2559918 RepID=A0ABW1RXU2_9LACO|nr:MucBP domain-containing protein [Lactiplantibacillus daowaiensis]
MINSKQHFKMYKKGKQWLVAGITTSVLAFGAWDVVTVQADTVTSDVPDATSTTTGTTTAGQTTTLKSGTTDADKASGQDTPNKTEATNNSSSNTTTDSSTTDQTSSKPVATDTDQGTSESDVKTTTPTESSVTTQKAPADKESAPATTNKTTTTSTDQSVVTPKTTQPTTQSASTTTPASASNASDSPAAVDIPKSVSRVQAMPRTRAMAQPVAEVTAVTDDDIDTWMPNKTLQQVVLNTLNRGNYGKTWASVADIKQSDMLYLTEFSLQGTETYIDGKTSFSIEGLQYATNLTSLDLTERVDLPSEVMHGDITDISPVAALTNLTYFQMVSQRVSDITPLAGLKKLTSLTVPYNEITDFSSLDATQYTDRLSIASQVIVQPVVYVPTTGKYTMLNPVKPPKNMTFTFTSGARIIFATSPSAANPQIRLYYSGATNAANGDYIDFQVTQNQHIPGPTTSPYPQYTVLQNPYTYYLSQIVSDADGNEIADVFTPYLIANNAEDVTVNYVDEQGKPLADSETLSGLVGEGYTATAKAIKGYKLTTPPDNATGTFSATAQTVTFVYQMAYSTVTVHYQDANGQTIQADTTATGQVGTDFNITAPSILGYKYQSTQGDATGTYGDDPTEVTFIYNEAYSTVTVHYQDANGKTIQADTTETGQIGTNFAIQAPTLVGYTYQSTQGDATGTYGDTPTEVTFVYDEAHSTVTVHYQTTDGQTIQADTTETGQIGTDFAIQAPTLVGYKYQSTQGDATGTYGDAPTEVTFIYQVVNSTVTVHYRDTDGQTLQADDVFTGQVGTNYDVKIPTILGYNYQMAQTRRITGTYTDAPTELTLVYRAVQSTVTVHYQDTTGKTLQADTVLTGQVGTTYTVAAPTILGYTYQTAQGQLTGAYGAQPVTVTLVYQADAVTPPVTPDQAATVIVHYVTKQGQQLAPDKLFTGRTGTTYMTQAAKISGYQLVVTPANATGTLGTDDIEVTYVYESVTDSGTGDTINPETPGTTKPVTKPTATKPAGQAPVKGQPTTTVSAAKIKPTVTTGNGQLAATPSSVASAKVIASNSVTTQATTELPQTKEQASSPFWGLALLGSLLGLAGWRKRTH